MKQRLLDRQGRLYTQRTPAVVRFHRLTFSAGDAYFAQRLMLTMPFRNVVDLKAGMPTWRMAFALRHEQQLSARDRNGGAAADAVHFCRDMVDAIMLQQRAHDDPVVATILRRELFGLASLVARPYASAATDVDATVAALGAEQFGALALIMQAVSDDAGATFFLTGEAGTGKSHVLRSLISAARQEHGPDSVAVLAPTGLAASLIGGLTLHSYFAIKDASATTSEAPHFTSLALANSAWVRDIQERVRLVVIDECSMVPAELLACVDELLQRARASQAPFGGLCVVLCGDCCQLKPVKGNYFFFFTNIALDAHTRSQEELPPRTRRSLRGPPEPRSPRRLK